MEKYCNGGDLPRVIQSGDVIYFESYEWYENLEDGELKDEALNRTNNEYETQENNGCFDEHELMGDNDDDIDDSEDYLI
ncbi:hypothetical protein Tco_0913110 [Tanacetum coccineum]